MATANSRNFDHDSLGGRSDFKSRIEISCSHFCRRIFYPCRGCKQHRAYEFNPDSSRRGSAWRRCSRVGALLCHARMHMSVARVKMHTERVAKSAPESIYTKMKECQECS